jgi:hypothetical protein
MTHAFLQLKGPNLVSPGSGLYRREILLSSRMINLPMQCSGQGLAEPEVARLVHPVGRKKSRAHARLF